MRLVLFLASYWVNYMLLGLYGPFFYLLCTLLGSQDLIRFIDQNPHTDFWVLTGAILIPGLLMKFSAFQRVLIRASGYQPARGEYRQKMEAALAPIIQRGHLEGQTFHLYVDPTKVLNAFALGTDNIVVNEPMFQFLSTDELTGVLAHEMGHLQKGHTGMLLLLWGMTLCNRFFFTIYQTFVRVAVFFMFIPVLGWVLMLFVMFMNFLLSMGNALLNIPLSLFNRYCSRQNETEADLYACQLGFGRQLAESLTRMEETMAGGLIHLNFFQKLWADHPDTPERLQRIQQYLDEHEKFGDDVVDAEYKDL